MTDLPPDRCVAGGSPFEVFGIDFFGLICVKVNPSPVKRWGCISTCFKSRAVQAKVLNSLKTNAFITGFVCFASRRGCLAMVYCDDITVHMSLRPMQTCPHVFDSLTKPRSRLQQDVKVLNGCSTRLSHDIMEGFGGGCPLEMISSLCRFSKLCESIEIIDGDLTNSPQTASLTEYLPVHRMYLHNLRFNFSNI